MEYIVFALFLAVSFLWLWLCVKTYSWFTIKGLLLHMTLFGILSVVVIWFVAQLVFLPVDSTYSASNIRALGILIVMLLICMAISTVIAWGINIEKLMFYKEKQQKGEK